MKRAMTCAALSIVVAVTSGLAAPGSAVAASPEAFAEQTFSAVQSDLKGERSDTDVVRERMRNLIHFKRLSYGVLGPEARGLSRDELKRFREAFRPFIIQVLSAQLLSNRQGLLGSFEATKSATRSVNGREYARVHGRLEYRNTTISVELRLLKSNGAWKAYDVKLDSFSLTENYRSQFQSVLANGSINDLIRRLNRRAGEGG